MPLSVNAPAGWGATRLANFPNDPIAVEDETRGDERCSVGGSNMPRPSRPLLSTASWRFESRTSQEPGVLPPMAVMAGATNLAPFGICASVSASLRLFPPRLAGGNPIDRI